MRGEQRRRMTPETEALVAYAHEHHVHVPEDGVPKRHVAVVTCMDARIDAFTIFGLGAGEVHVIRNAGGVVTDDVLRSLVLSQRLLQTREILLMHHTRCGLQRTDEAELRAAIRAETGSEPDYAFGTFRDVDEDIRRGMARVREHPYLPHRDQVRGFVFDVESGDIREVVG
jgi:carbonic anhydrase